MVILIVEDEYKIAGLLKTGLEHAKFTVEIARNCTEAMRRLETYDYDAIILDIMLPDGDGYELCQRLRSMGNTAPILMLTARGQIHDKVKGLNAGADDYLIKPFALPEITARIHALLRRTPELKPVTLRSNSLELNTSARNVRCGEKLIKLGRKEFQLLELLMRQKGTVCSRTMLIERVWGYKPTTNNTLDVHMASLKRKIDNACAEKHIYTIYGKGYKLV